MTDQPQITRYYVGSNKQLLERQPTSRWADPKYKAETAAKISATRNANKLSGVAKKIIRNGIEYKSVSACAKAIGVAYKTALRWHAVGKLCDDILEVKLTESLVINGETIELHD
jgi:hypothetical protein